MKQGLVLLVLLWSSCLFSSSGDETGGGDMGSDLGDMPGDLRESDGSIATCGDGLLQADETCDPLLPPESPGACPTSCDDGAACTRDILVGSPDSCDAACSVEVITACQNNDGCCPSDCTVANDSDCDDEAVCGDGVLAEAETCDPGIATGAGSCPIIDSCEPVLCEIPRVIGSRTNCDARCAGVPITLCFDSDGCCAPGCDSANDSDCIPGCGNAIIDPGELCDGNCPTADMCDDGNPCTVDMLVGDPATCDAECVHTALDVCMDGDMCCPSNCSNANDADCSATCGNGVIDASETCEAGTPTPCPETCSDGDACTRDGSTGSPTNCNVVCTFDPISSCVNDDGCCPAACNANNDNDCEPACGNNVTEAGETCDGNCPTACDDSAACTVDTLVGSPDACTAQCQYTPRTACSNGDGCCPDACNANNDDDCGSICGNAVTEPGETCDGDCPPSCNDNNACTTDVRSGSAMNCNVTCSYTDVTTCVNNDGCCPANCNSQNDNDCSASCGNNLVETGETCDGNCPTLAQCQQMYGACAQLSGSPSQCNVVCSQQSNCTPCDLNATCNCQPGQICSGGRCTGSSGDDCDMACDGDAYCSVHGPGSTCSPASTCIDCTMSAECNYDEACVQNLCVPAQSCDEAADPDQFCQQNEGYDACNLQVGECMNTCQVNTDCGPTQTCLAGWCVPAMNCGEASNPDAFCPLNFICVGDTCRRQCNPNNLNCECNNKTTQSCRAVQTPFCDDVLPSNCNDVCPGWRDAYCVQQNGSGSICNPVWGGGADGCGVGSGSDMGPPPPDGGGGDVKLP